jgi:hypothetical protein
VTELKAQEQQDIASDLFRRDLEAVPESVLLRWSDEGFLGHLDWAAEPSRTSGLWFLGFIGALEVFAGRPPRGTSRNLRDLRRAAQAATRRAAADRFVSPIGYGSLARMVADPTAERLTIWPILRYIMLVVTLFNRPPEAKDRIDTDRIGKCQYSRCGRFVFNTSTNYRTQPIKGCNREHATMAGQERNRDAERGRPGPAKRIPTLPGRRLTRK